jgi:hypothetical protein
MLLLKMILLFVTSLCLTACGTLSTRSDASATDTRPRAAHVSETALAECKDLVIIPPKASDDAQWRLWGQDRRLFAECREMNAEKANVIRALQAQGAK